MKKEQIKSLIQNLARSQGFYGRLLHSIEQSPNQKAIWDELEAQNFKNDLDVVFFFEC
jgi:hypothetical protein